MGGRMVEYREDAGDNNSELGASTHSHGELITTAAED